MNYPQKGQPIKASDFAGFVRRDDVFPRANQSARLAPHAHPFEVSAYKTGDSVISWQCAAGTWFGDGLKSEGKINSNAWRISGSETGDNDPVTGTTAFANCWIVLEANLNQWTGNQNETRWKLYSAPICKAVATLSQTQSKVQIPVAQITVSGADVFVDQILRGDFFFAGTGINLQPFPDIPPPANPAWPLKVTLSEFGTWWYSDEGAGHTACRAVVNIEGGYWRGDGTKVPQGITDGDSHEIDTVYIPPATAAAEDFATNAYVVVETTRNFGQYELSTVGSPQILHSVSNEYLAAHPGTMVLAKLGVTWDEAGTEYLTEIQYTNFGNITIPVVPGVKTPFVFHLKDGGYSTAGATYEAKGGTLKISPHQVFAKQKIWEQFPGGNNHEWKDEYYPTENTYGTKLFQIADKEVSLTAEECAIGGILFIQVNVSFDEANFDFSATTSWGFLPATELSADWMRRVEMGQPLKHDKILNLTEDNGTSLVRDFEEKWKSPSGTSVTVVPVCAFIPGANGSRPPHPEIINCGVINITPTVQLLYRRDAQGGGNLQNQK